MVDRDFIEHRLQRGVEARQKVLQAFSGLTLKQFNWKASPASWSIAQCLEHLLISDSAYFGILEEIVKGKYSMTFWEKYSPFTGLFGKLLKDQLQEQVKRKMKTHIKLTPQTTEKGLHFLNEYIENLDIFQNYISKCIHVDLDKTIVTSPAIKIVTYSLRDAFQFLVEHEHRHIKQAIRVTEDLNFPKV